MYVSNQKKSLTTIFILLLLFNIIYTIVISNSNNYNNNIIYANSLTNNRVLYIDESGKLNTTNVEPNSLNDIINNFKAQLLDIIYPVGSIYISVNNVSPASFLGGSWTSIGAGRTLVGVDTSDSDFNTVEKTGGEKTHTLTIAEIPSHNHTIAHTHTRGTMNITGYFTGQYSVFNQSYGGAMYKYAGYGHGFSGGGGGGEGVGFDASRNWIGSTSQPNNDSSGNQGDGQSHNNLQPYITVYMWKRTQ